MAYLFLLGAIIAEVSATLSLRMAATGVRAYYAAVAGGYLLVHRGDTPGVEGYLSASECLACQFPGYWALAWADVDVEERRELLAHWGADPVGLPALVAAATDAFEAGRIGWPAVFASLKTARKFASRHHVTHPTLTLIGLGLPRDRVEEFIADGEDDGFTASGAHVRPGAAAVDPRVIPMGTSFVVEGYGVFTALDTPVDVHVGKLVAGSGRGNSHRLDLFLDVLPFHRLAGDALVRGLDRGPRRREGERRRGEVAERLHRMRHGPLDHLGHGHGITPPGVRPRGARLQ